MSNEQLTRAKALRIFQDWARSKRATWSEKALLEFHSDFGRKADPKDALAAVCRATDANIHKCEPDDTERFRGNTVLVLRVPLRGETAYIKATMNLEMDHNVFIYSCKIK